MSMETCFPQDNSTHCASNFFPTIQTQQINSKVKYNAFTMTLF
jgi:hypothetical protein